MAVETLPRTLRENPLTDKQAAAAKAKIEARKRFEDVFPLLVEELTSYLESIHLPDNAIEWYKKVNISSFKELRNNRIWITILLAGS
jgi:hypothetical protein